MMAVTLNATRTMSILVTCTLVQRRLQGIKPSSCLVFGAMFIGKMVSEMACIQTIYEIRIRDPLNGDERVISNGTCFPVTTEWQWLIDAGFAVWYYV